MQDPNTKIRDFKRQHSPGALADSPPTKRQRASAPFPTDLRQIQQNASGVQRDSGAVLTEDTKMSISGDRRLQTDEEILNANANARVSTRKTRAKPAFKTVNTSVLATRRTWQAVEDPLADVVYKSAHQRRIKFDIWQNDRLLLEFAVEDHEDFEARFQALRDKLVALRTGPMNESEKWYEALEMRMAKIRARARIVLQRGGTSYMGANRKKSWTSSPGGSSEEGEPGSSSLRQSVAVMTEDNGESVGEEDESAEEWEDEVSGDEGWGSEYDASDEEDTDEESEDSAIDDNDDDDYH